MQRQEGRQLPAHGVIAKVSRQVADSDAISAACQLQPLEVQETVDESGKEEEAV